MKGKRGGASTKVMLALLAVLLVSLGFLSSQGREGFREGQTDCLPGMSKKGNSKVCTAGA